ncbi:MAG: hypothetical protein K2L67_01230 [Clostridia bacterium]|nr:hypothetical protein [Clostridia bacterium]
MIEKIELGEECGNLSANALDFYQKMKELLNKEQNELFEKFVNANMQYEGRCEEIYFNEGFKAGFRIAVECLYDC